MSAQALETILARLYVESGFRQRFLDDREDALAGFDLTPAEKEELSRIDRIGLVMASRSYEAKRDNRPQGASNPRWKLPFG